MNLVIRKARSSDAQALTVLLNLSDTGQHVCSDASQVATSLESNSTERVFLALDREKLVGFIALQVTQSFCYLQSTAEITELYVSEPKRCKGIAEGLVSEAIHFCRKEKCLEVFLRVNSGNHGAIRLYERCGLKPVKHHEYRIKFSGTAGGAPPNLASHADRLRRPVEARPLLRSQGVGACGE